MMQTNVVSIPWSVLYAIDLTAIALFAISYYRKCYRRGYRVDFWYSQLFLSCVLSNMLMLPFAKSELNTFVVGKDMAAIITVLPTVFLITMAGYVSMLAGGGVWRLKCGLGIRKTAMRVMDILPRCSMMLMSSQRVLVFQAAIGVVLQWLILGFYFSQMGIGFNLRYYTFANPTLRPIALLISNYSVFIGSHCLARYIDTKERVLLFCTLILTLGLFFFGARANVLGIYLGVFLCYLVKRRDSISLLRLISTIVFTTIAGLYLGLLRDGSASLADFVATLTYLMFYGSNFSDLRDFSWVYSAWDHHLWGGKTYLAAAAAFVPRFASQFRDTWVIGAATDSTVGLDPQVHPGLRPGQFGEGFFNFGLLGVVAIGFIAGMVLRRVDTDVKAAFTSPHPSMRKAFASTSLFAVSSVFAVSGTCTALYILLGTYLFSWFCLSAERMFQPRQVLIQGTD